MKKIAKLSLVAAVAVAGLTSANATALEEAIKGVDISGTAVYRYDDRTSADQTNGNKADNSYKIAINLKSSLNDDLTFNTRTVIGGGNTDMAVIKADDSADGEAKFALTQANFAYTGLANTTIIAGKQAVPSPFAVAADAAGDEDTGTGLVAVMNAGPVTVAAGYFNNTNLATGLQDIAAVGILGNVGPVALDAWYLDVTDNKADDTGHAAYSIGAKAKIEMVNLTARHSAVSHETTGADTESLTKFGASAKVGIVSASLDYGFTNNVKGATTGTGLTGDSDAEVSLQAWALNLQDSSDDAQLIKASVGVDVTPAVNLSATYADLSVDSAAKSDAKEYYGQATYKMGKNFSTYLRLGKVEKDAKTDEETRGRLHVQYTF